MKISAAVLYEPHQELQVEEIDLAEPKAREVLVRIVASGVCGSDTHVLDGDMLFFGIPIVPGHEAAGVVEAVGPDVVAVTPGDHVLINLFPGCGACAPCCAGRSYACMNQRPGFLFDGTSRMSKGDQVIHHFTNVSSFADHVVVPERGCIKIREDAPLEKVCLISCGITTGISAVWHRAKVEQGASAVVVGCGGVGLNVIQGLAMAGATTIVAVDVSDFKLDMAKQLGATDVVNAASEDPIDATRQITGGMGADYGFEVISTGRTIRQAFDATRPGGTVTVVGIPPMGDTLELPAGVGRTLTNGGLSDANPWEFFPLLVDLYMDGRLKIDELITRTRPLAEVNDAFAALRAGEVARTVLVPA